MYSIAGNTERKQKKTDALPLPLPLLIDSCWVFGFFLTDIHETRFSDLPISPNSRRLHEEFWLAFCLKGVIIENEELPDDLLPGNVMSVVIRVIGYK